MPNKNGIEAMLEIKEYEKEQNIDSLTPIIALTANALSGDEQKYMDMGFDSYLAKPLDVDKLSDLLLKYIK
jgi:CheY-like chemotaxis protein